LQHGGVAVAWAGPVGGSTTEIGVGAVSQLLIETAGVVKLAQPCFNGKLFGGGEPPAIVLSSLLAAFHNGGSCRTLCLAGMPRVLNNAACLAPPCFTPRQMGSTLHRGDQALQTAHPDSRPAQRRIVTWGAVHHVGTTRAATMAVANTGKQPPHLPGPGDGVKITPGQGQASPGADPPSGWAPW
jgi:hypothetical protein